jgi:quercetin dioxygenase-like cupin family protein
MKNQTSDYRNVVVRKPWGEEYLCYQNEELAIWLLHIKEGCATSFHCHPNKNTGFIVLGGSVLLSFMRNQVVLNALEKIHIFRARFHSSRALSKGGAFVMEIETPEDKRDLVRLEDQYGRQGLSYEGVEHERPKDSACFWLEEPNVLKDTGANEIQQIAQAKLEHIKPQGKDELFGFPEDTSFVVTRGGVFAEEEKKLLSPGDIIDGASLQRLLQSFHLIEGSTFIRVRS